MNFIEHTQHHDVEGTTQPIPVSVQVSDGDSDIIGTSLFWRLEGSLTYIEVPMISEGGGLYTSEIPPPGVPTTIYYYISVEYPFFEWLIPVGAACEYGDVYSFMVRSSMIRGDVTDDEIVNILDVVAVINHILEIETITDPDALWRSDCNGDGETNILDASGIVNVILGTGTCEP